MKIFYFTPFYPPQGEAAATRSFWFVRTLGERHTVEVFTPCEAPDVHRLYFRTASNKSGLIQRLLKEVLLGIELMFRVLFSDADYFVFSSPPFFSSVLASYAVSLRGKKYLCDVRDLYPEVFFEMKVVKADSLGGKFLKALAADYYRRAAQIVTVTEGLVKHIRNQGYGKKVSLIRNGYDDELFFPGESVKSEKFFLVFHGTLGKAQNIDTLLKVAQKLEAYPDVEILVAGDGPKLSEITRANPKNISYLGVMNYQEIPELLRKAHVGLSFRTDDMIGKEAFPVKVFEYIGTGLPVILTPKGEASDMIEAKDLGKGFENTEIDDICRTILTIKDGGLSFQKSQEFSRRNSSKLLLELVR